MKVFTHQIPDASQIRASRFIEGVNEYHFQSDEPIELIPQGRFEMIFQVEGEFLHRTGSTIEWFDRPQAFLGGLHSCSYDVRAKSGEGTCLGISLKPAMVHLLIQDKLNQFENAVVDLEDVFGNRGRFLAESMMHDSPFNIKMQRIDEFFSSFAQDSTIPDSSALIEQSLLASDHCRIADLSQNVGLSESHFRRLFRELVGINAKRFFKIRRVNKAIGMIKRDSSTRLTQLAYELGFYDQAHFIREFRSVTGRTPKYFMNRDQ